MNLDHRTNSIENILDNYRPFTMEEFIKKFPLLSTIVITDINDADSNEISCTVGYAKNDFVFLGTYLYSLEDLFHNYKYKDPMTNEWVCFGVIR